MNTTEGRRIVAIIALTLAVVALVMSGAAFPIIPIAVALLAILHVF